MRQNRRLRAWLPAVVALCAAVGLAECAFGKTNYVSLSGSQTPPYDNWQRAFTNLIQAAASSATQDGDTLLVTNGVYGLTNQIVVNKAIRVVSLHGAAYTTVQRASTANRRLFYVNHPQAVVDGFYVTGGITPNSPGGGGIYLDGGTVQNCTIAANTGSGAAYHGGGIYVKTGLVQRCVIRNNTVVSGGISGGGVAMAAGGLLRDSQVLNNQAYVSGGGVYGGTVERCVIKGNSGKYNFYLSGGGVANAVVRNSLIVSNSTDQSATASPPLRGGGAYLCTLQNCTVVGNTAYGEGGGVYGGTMRNCVVYGNKSYGNNTMDYGGNCDFAFSCTTPLPAGMGNTAADPRFVGAAAGYRLLPGSPCIGTGTNGSWAVGSTDLDTNAWVSPVGMGAYAFNATNPPFRCGFAADVREGRAPLTVTFTGYAAGTNTSGLHYRWDLNNDGTVDQPDTAVVTKTYSAGLFGVSLIVSNAVGQVARCSNAVHIVSAPTTVYVSTNGTYTSPYTNWATAARSLFSALALGIDGTTILCSNGTFNVDREVYVSKGVTIRGLNGASKTIVRRSGSSAYRVFAVANTNAVLDGLTITRGRVSGTYGGGLWLGGGLVKNCIITGNMAYNGGGCGGMVLSGTVQDSQIIFNRDGFSDSGGNNGGGSAGGGLYMTGGLLLNSWVHCNTNPSAAGIYGGTALGCLFSGNNAYGNVNPYGGGAYNSTLENCTVVTNVSRTNGGGLYNCTAKNCVVYDNGAPASPNISGGTTTYSCSPGLTGTRNITNNPAFQNPATGNYRLHRDSPCINVGTNLAWMVGAVDLDGKTRVRGTYPDMGAYEYPLPFGTAVTLR